MPEEKAKKKKVRNLSKKECETILFKLSNQTQSKYYKDVYQHLEHLKGK
jgi:hypothetical protein